MAFKPLLAPGEDPKSFPDYFKKIQYPLLCSPKYDGIRCTVKSGVCLSRTGKMLPSFQVQEMFSHLKDLDGEIIEGNATDFDVYNRTQSHVMSEDKPGDLKYYVFDYTHPDFLMKPFYERLEHAEAIIGMYDRTDIILVNHEYVETYDELIAFENKCLEAGFEGIMMRNPVAHYKQGRGTFREGIIYKLKRFQDAEAVILDILEGNNNHNELKYDELGFAKRSDSKENKTPSGMAGQYIVSFKGMELIIAPGHFKHHERVEHLRNKAEYIGRTLKFRYFNKGVKDLPRFPRAIGFRSKIDV